MLNKIFDFHDSEVRFFLILLLLLSVTFVSSLILGARVDRRDASTPTVVVRHNFPQVPITAKSAYVYDLRTQTVLFARNENTRLPLASLTKVMTALVAEESLSAGSTVTVTQEALTPEGDSGLKVSEHWRLKDLIDFSLVSSSNDGIHAVALAIGSQGNRNSDEVVDDFVKKMNEKAHSLGLKNTYFWNDTGLDESEVKGGAYGTAREMAELFRYILSAHPDLMEATRESSTTLTSLDAEAHAAHNTNVITSEIPGLIASKTGFTETAGGNLVFVFDPELGRPIVISILGSTQEGRFTDARALVSATLQYLAEEE